MKKYSVLFVILLCASACSKKDADALTIFGKGCVEQLIVKQDAHQVSAIDYAKVVRLFQQNNISLRDLLFLQYSEENLTVNGVISHYTHIKAAQYSNGLSFFYGEVAYHFKEGSFYFLSGNKLVTSVSPTANLSLVTVRSLFFKEFMEYNKQYSYYKAADFADKCVTAELGYYNVNATTTPIKIVRAWRVTPKGQDYPVAYINDENSATIYFFDGIINLGR